MTPGITGEEEGSMLAKAWKGGWGRNGRGFVLPGRRGRRWSESLPCREDGCCCAAALAPGQGGCIKEVPDHPLLPALGIRPGKKLRMAACQPFGGPIVAQVDGRSVALARRLARQIFLHCGEG